MTRRLTLPIASLALFLLALGCHSFVSASEPDRVSQLTQLPDASQDPAFYRQRLAAIDDWIRGNPAEPRLQEVQTARAAFVAEAERVDKGEARVAEVWFTPLAATLRDVDLKTLGAEKEALEAVKRSEARLLSRLIPPGPTFSVEMTGSRFFPAAYSNVLAALSARAGKESGGPVQTNLRERNIAERNRLESDLRRIIDRPAPQIPGLDFEKMNDKRRAEANERYMTYGNKYYPRDSILLDRTPFAQFMKDAFVPVRPLSIAEREKAEELLAKWNAVNERLFETGPPEESAQAIASVQEVADAFAAFPIGNLVNAHRAAQDVRAQVRGSALGLDEAIPQMEAALRESKNANAISQEILGTLDDLLSEAAALAEAGKASEANEKLNRASKWQRAFQRSVTGASTVFAAVEKIQNTVASRQASNRAGEIADDVQKRLAANDFLGALTMVDQQFNAPGTGLRGPGQKALELQLGQTAFKIYEGALAAKNYEVARAALSLVTRTEFPDEKMADTLGELARATQTAIKRKNYEEAKGLSSLLSTVLAPLSGADLARKELADLAVEQAYQDLFAIQPQQAYQASEVASRLSPDHDKNGIFRMTFWGSCAVTGLLGLGILFKLLDLLTLGRRRN